MRTIIAGYECRIAPGTVRRPDLYSVSVRKRR
jgi:hypothetical protein